jgi:hypothetical protein
MKCNAQEQKNDSFWTKYIVIALCYFFCPVHNLKTSSGNSIQPHTIVKRNERKCSVQYP